MKDLSSLKGVGESTLKKLKTLGIESVGDLMWNFPRRYDDFSDIISLDKLSPGVVTIKAKIISAKGRYVRRGMHITEAVASADSGSVRLVWFNQPYRADSLDSKKDYYISGKYELSRQKFAIMNPKVELASNFPVNTARIVPIYRETKGIKSAALRKLLAQLTDEMSSYPEVLPSDVVAEHALISRGEALRQIHFPDSMESLDEAKWRLGFEEVYALVLAALTNRQQAKNEIAPKILFDQKLAVDFVSKLPYELTDSQRKVAWQSYKDIQKTHPMNRLIEGDVGAGKTVVAAMLSVMAISQGYQVAVMAPTELLARQHAETIQGLLSSIGKGQNVVLLLGSMTSSQKSIAQAQIKSQEGLVIVGTHALISEKVGMNRLGLVVVDEQHRFGVEQRRKLQQKAGHMPHTLSMTATPIPRTLALTLYGELDISVMDQKPGDRLSIITEVVPSGARPDLYRKVDAQIEAGRQVFVVCPLISDSESIKALSVEKVYEGLSGKVFKHRRVGLLHGKMKAEEKDRVMSNFAKGQLDVLVSTTVVEVGVDVPNATVMIIEGAERFGLAQMHQLRGRVGRSHHQGYCYLLTTDNNPPTKRLRAIEHSDNGFKLAEMDLELRGPGAIYGRMQHGQLDLRVAQLTDTKLISIARQAANDFIEEGLALEDYPELKSHVEGYRSVTFLN